MGNKQAILSITITWLLLSYITVLGQFSDMAHLGMSILFGLAVWDLQTRRETRPALKLRQPQAFIGGGAAVLLGLLNLRFPSFWLVRSVPFVGGLSVVLMAYGLSGFKTFWRELLLLFFMGLPSVIVPVLPDPSPLAARFGALLLSLFGVDAVFEDGTNLVLPSGAVQVFRGCSGLEYMTYLLGLSVLCMVLFPISGRKRFWVPLIGVGVGFVVNGFRVALLAVLASQNDLVSFDYWHEGPGSLLFGGVAVLVFGGFYSLVLKADHQRKWSMKL